jgi:hypothetical protein
VVRAHPTVPPHLNSPPQLQYFADRSLFARAKIQKALQMAVRMAALTRSKSGNFFARKVIPLMCEKHTRASTESVGKHS